MSERYIHDRFLPDKAIDVIDEAASKVNLSNIKLVEIQKLENEINEINQKEADLPDDDYEGKAMLKSEVCRIGEKLMSSRAKSLPEFTVFWLRMRMVAVVELPLFQIW